MTQYLSYVYAYLRPDGTPYYIGKGKKDRAYDIHKYTPVPRDKSRIIFLETNLSELGAFALERRYIRWYGRKDNNTGTLINMTDGGEGAAGGIVSEETRKKLSVRNTGKIRSIETRRKMSESGLGRIFSAVHKQRMSESIKGRTISAEHRRKISDSNKGKIFSEETRRKMSESAKKRCERNRRQYAS